MVLGPPAWAWPSSGLCRVLRAPFVGACPALPVLGHLAAARLKPLCTDQRAWLVAAQALRHLAWLAKGISALGQEEPSAG